MHNKGLNISIILIFCYLLLVDISFASAKQPYFFEMEAANSKQSSCENIFAQAGKKDFLDDLAGDVIYNLNYININYLLEDYDDATRPGSDKKYVSKEELTTEIKARKRDIYCRVELAIYLSKQPAEVIFGFERFIDEAVEKLEDTYQSALESYQKKDYERARYAFDLIAPYRDARVKLASSTKVLKAEEKIAKASVKDKKHAKPVQKKTETIASNKQGSSIKRVETRSETMSGKTVEPVTMVKQPVEKSAEKPQQKMMKDIGPIAKAALAGVTDSSTEPGPILRAAMRM